MNTMYSIDYICGAIWKSVITNGLVFFTSQITFKKLIIDEYVACVTWCCATLVDVIAQIFSQRMDNNVFRLYIALVTSNWLLTVWDRNKGVVRCSIIVLSSKVRHDDKITFCRDTKHFWGGATKLFSGVWHLVLSWWIFRPLLFLHIFPQLHIFPGWLLIGLFIVAALSFSFSLTLTSVARLQLLILPSFRAVLGAFLLLLLVVMIY